VRRRRRLLRRGHGCVAEHGPARLVDLEDARTPASPGSDVELSRLREKANPLRGLVGQSQVGDRDRVLSRQDLDVEPNVVVDRCERIAVDRDWLNGASASHSKNGDRLRRTWGARVLRNHERGSAAREWRDCCQGDEEPRPSGSGTGSPGVHAGQCSPRNRRRQTAQGSSALSLASETSARDVAVGGVRADTDHAQAGSAIARQRIRCARILDTRVLENWTSLRDADLAARAASGARLVAAGAVGAALDVEHPNVVLAGGSRFSAVRTGVVSARFAEHVGAGIARRSGLRHRLRAGWSRATPAQIRNPLAILTAQQAAAAHLLNANAAFHASAAWLAIARTRRTAAACARRSSRARASAHAHAPAHAHASARARSGVGACRAACAAVGRLVVSDRASACRGQRERDRSAEQSGSPAPTHASDFSSAE
jgi:hypothetical protein